MEIRAKLKNARMAPRKVRLLSDVVVGLPVREARSQLTWQQGAAADIVLGVLNSAAANAQHNHEIEEDNLRVVRLVIDEGITAKRFRPASRGVAHPYAKRASHVTVVLDEIQPQKRATTEKRVTEIDTVTAEDLVRRERASEEDSEDKSESKTEGDFPAHQKKKMQQGGGKKKTYRRKSM